ncbi:MAG TPA: hypothetical protein DHN29_15520 [Cytophagales bacterium]|nr:hypothetical protein [Cytophagales bacterium]|tara:strand:+ start:1966 stop:2319 length:354 start_codon:yes stop_codon:yes gene_type:complete
MPFGKFSGCLFNEIDDSYLDWLMTLPDLNIKWPGLRQDLEEEFNRRYNKAYGNKSFQLNGVTISPDSINTVAKIIRTGYKRLALDHHPDRGDEEDMKELNNAMDLLRSIIGEKKNGA